MREIVQRNNSFVIDEDGREVAELTFVVDGQRMVIDHTYVSVELRGQNIASQLVQRAADFARENSYKVVPACSYAHTWFRRHPDYADVWKK